MKKIMLCFLALFLVVFIPNVFADSCVAGCSSCQYEWDECVGCEREDYIINWTMNPCVEKNLNYSGDVVIKVSAMSYYISESGLGLRYYYCQNVSYRVRWLWGEANESDTGWIGYNYPGNIKTFNFTANQSGDMSALIEVKYDSNASWGRRIVNFTIASASDNDPANVVYGDCISTSYGGLDNWGNNAIYNSGNLSDYWTRSIIWTFIMFIGVGAAWFGMNQSRGYEGLKLGVVALIGVFLLIIGAASRMIDWIYVGVVFLFAAAYVGIKIARSFTR